MNLADQMKQLGTDIQLALATNQLVPPEDIYHELLKMSAHLISASTHIRPYLKENK